MFIYNVICCRVECQCLLNDYLLIAIGDECTIDIDCTVKNAVCQDFVCVEKSESEETTEHLTDLIFTAVTNESMGKR